VLGAANYIGVAICGLTNAKPATACPPTVEARHGKMS
jgi:hypothetical protein